MDGHEQAGDGWVYVPAVSALLQDPEGVWGLKAALEAGQDVEAGEEMVGRVAVASPDQVARVLRQARTAQSAWARTPLEHRLDFIAAMHQAFKDHFAELVGLLVAEGHPVQVARWEVNGMIETSAPAALARLATMMKSSSRSPDGRELHLVRKADGVVCISPPANAAMSNGAMGLWALAAGNALVVGAPRSAPLSVVHLYQRVAAPILDRFGAPPGLLGVTCGSTKGFIDTWTASADVDDVFFFGSAEHGRQVLLGCIAAAKKPVLELSGNDGMIVWKDAEVELAAEALAQCFYASGQICMVPRYAVVHPDVADRLVKLLTELAETLTPALPEDETTVACPVLRGREFVEAVEQVRAAGGTITTGGYLTGLSGGTDPHGLFAAPTVARLDGLATAAGLPAVTEETFFPLLCLLVPEPACDDTLLTEAIGFLNGNAYGLRNSVWARDPAVLERACTEIASGGLLKINDSHIGFVAGLPSHGGTGLTGGPYGEGAFPILQTSHLQGISIATTVQPRESILEH
ncbi:aldehyde dehydrogenase family protein [Streptomyces spectabilis]|uniref:aldehyde dehydrogenase family protein n=1 Tax=Streptomyces spectabilis TaxID=68270 RepID=UPI001376CA9F|nr:aldehyde dehydrogenase [Streptomyces spectabilis]